MTMQKLGYFSPKQKNTTVWNLPQGHELGPCAQPEVEDPVIERISHVIFNSPALRQRAACSRLPLTTKTITFE